MDHYYQSSVMEAKGKTLQILITLFISTSGSVLHNDTVLFAKKLLDYAKAMHSSEESFQENFANVGSYYIPINSTSEICRAHSKYAFNSYLNAEVWALKMVDAGSKMPSGMLGSNLRDFGNLDECLNILAPGNLFTGQYCLVEIDGMIPGIARQMIPEVYGEAYTFGACVPSTCSVNDIKAHFDSHFEGLNTSAFVVEDSCVTNSKSNPLTTGEWFALILVVSLVSTVVLATVYDINVKTENPPFLVVFSLKRNFPRMFSNKIDPTAIACLNGLRFLAICWVIMGHRALIFLWHPNIDFTSIFGEVTSSLKWTIINNGILSVDMFFFMTGFLVSFGYFRHRKLGVKIPILYFYLGRYLRLTPSFAFIVALYINFGHRIGDGPFSKTTARDIASVCKIKWWNTLLYIHNYTQPQKICLGFSWYLAVDFQLFLFSPVLLIPLYRNPKLGSILTAIALAFTSIAGLWNAYIHGLRAGGAASIDGRTLKNFSEEFIVTHLRAAPFIIGVAMGFLILKIKEGHIVLKPSKAVITALWVFSLFMTIFPIAFVCYFHQPDYVYNQWLELFYQVFHRHVFTLGLSGIILLCVLGHGGIVNRFLSLSVFIPLTRLSYSAYLVHMVMQFLVTFSRRSPEYSTAFSLWHEFFGDLWFTYISSVFLYLLVECPCGNIVNILFPVNREKVKSSYVPPQLKESTTELPVQEEDLPK